MDNLDVASYKCFKYDKDITGEPVEASVEDNVCCFITNLSRLNIWRYTENLQTFELDRNIVNEVVQLKYLSIWQVVFIATRSSLIIFDLHTKELVVLHSFKTQITSTSWNPNETFLVVMDESNIYGFTFQVNVGEARFRLTDINTTNINIAVPASVYVGWGSHNTQFKGVIKKDQENISEVPQEYSPPRISWRGNGEQFVVNFWRDHKRFLKLFNKYLMPEFESIAHLNLLPSVSFKGHGNFIAGAAVHNDVNKIIIFEKNCLIKNEFWVPDNEGLVKCIQFHPDMNILAVYSEDLSTKGYLNIYVCYNAMWYLKQQLIYDCPNRLRSFHWTTVPDRDMCALDVLTATEIQRTVFRVIINRYPETSLVAVIDGATVYFTKFSDQIVPPPMASLSLHIGKPVKKIFFDHSRNIYQFLTSNNEVHSYFYEKCEFRRCSGVALPDLSVEAKNDTSNIIYKLECTVNDNRYEILLDKQQDLFINRQVVCHNVISVYIDGNYLLFTHASCKLYCVHLEPQNLLSSSWNLNKFYSREVEQGSKIVCVARNVDIILQLPRGNLEAVACRVIVIDAVEKLLSENKWEEAIVAIRLQRLSWNLLIDLNPVRFSEHIREFIEAAEKNSELHIIVSEFSNENCFQTIYQQCFNVEKPSFKHSKAEVFLNILKEIIHLNPVQYLISIVTLQIKHFTLKSALRSVCSVFRMSQLPMCIKAVNQILLHCHARDVINEALGLYDIDFMAFIYTCCAEDPRSFEPQLQQLRSLSPAERRYKMNMYAKNFKAATKYLVRISNTNDQNISDFVLKHSTQRIAYENTCQNNPYFKLISQLYANYLAIRARHDEAGFILTRAELYQEALEEYRKSLNWIHVLSLLKIINNKDYDKHQLLNLVNDLTQHNRVEEAVNILETHCKEYRMAIEILTEKQMFHKALCLARIYDSADLIDKLIKPAIVKHRTHLNEQIDELSSTFLESTARLQEIRKHKCLSLKGRFLDGGETVDNDDLYSEYGSIVSSRGSSSASSSSKGSTLSSRNRRKQEKKKIDLRKGGIYEDIALIRQLYLLIVDIFKCGEDVKDICLTLTDSDSFSDSSRLHRKLSKLQNSVKLEIPNIWTDTFLNSPDSTEPEILSVVQNRYELDAKFRIPPSSEILTDNWKLLLYS